MIYRNFRFEHPALRSAVQKNLWVKKIYQEFNNSAVNADIILTREDAMFDIWNGCSKQSVDPTLPC